MTEDNKKAPIDIEAIVKKLWPHRKKYFIVLPTVLIVTYLLTLCVPRYYKCTVSLAPELGGSAAQGSLGSLASSFGLGSLAKMAGNDDAINAELYPNLFKSNNFVIKLMPIEVRTKDGSIKCDYYTYLSKKQKAAPWDHAKHAITNLFVKAPKDNTNGKSKLDPFNLTKKQSELFENVKGKIKCDVDKKTDVITITVEDQDPLIAATMAEKSCQKLQEFITTYRTNKARIDYLYYKRLCGEAKTNYERARQLYGSYSDANTDVILQSFKSKTEDLENDMQLKYNVYSTLSTQMQMAQAKLQEATPAFTVLESASVPTKPAGPKRMITSIAMMLLSFFALTGWLLYKQRTKK